MSDFCLREGLGVAEWYKQGSRERERERDPGYCFSTFGVLSSRPKIDFTIYKYIKEFYAQTPLELIHMKNVLVTCHKGNRSSSQAALCKSSSDPGLA